MACMPFETGPKARFLSSARSAAGSKGSSLIQFMAATAKNLDDGYMVTLWRAVVRTLAMYSSEKERWPIHKMLD